MKERKKDIIANYLDYKGIKISSRIDINNYEPKIFFIASEGIHTIGYASCSKYNINDAINKIKLEIDSYISGTYIPESIQDEQEIDKIKNDIDLTMKKVFNV